MERGCPFREDFTLFAASRWERKHTWQAKRREKRHFFDFVYSNAFSVIQVGKLLTLEITDLDLK